MSQSYTFKISPACYIVPGTRIEQDSVIFSTIIRGSSDCGLLLYHLPDMEKVRVPFSDEFRYGDLYSVKISRLSPEKWAYEYYREDTTFTDPYARELMHVYLEGEKKILCRLYPVPETKIGSAPALAPLVWPNEVLYCLHVKGMTASRSSRTTRRGTFAALEQKIPHLKSIGVTVVELLPVYELCPEKDRPSGKAVSFSELSAEPPLDDKKTSKTNYWNFGKGYYFAPKAAYASTGKPLREFYHMVEAFHTEGIRVYLQLYFPETVSIQEQLETARFYKTHYHIDGFHLKGDDHALTAMAADPVLSDTVLLYYTFPYEKLSRENPEPAALYHLAEARDDYERLLRRFVKSDDLTMADFLREFIHVETGHGQIRYVTNYEGFTLMDLVSYNHKHNEDNGEENRDGNDNNLSWNCGVEGRSRKKEIRVLRMRQIKNFLTLLFLTQGTPMLTAGDELGNSQEGNNNPYCQDNEIGWVNWKDNEDSRVILKFTENISAFRKQHAVFRANRPFEMTDYKVYGYPDLSLHGKEAWKPDIEGCSHTIGVCYCENYAQPEQDEEHKAPARLLYVAINMHWDSQQLGLPTPPPGQEWRICVDTSAEDSFPEAMTAVKDEQCITLPGRTVQILETFKINEQ